jgi:Tol biopolymer transport system component
MKIAKINFNVKNQFQCQKSISIAKINFNDKNQFQWQKSISMAKVNFNGKNQFQRQKSISMAKVNFNGNAIKSIIKNPKKTNFQNKHRNAYFGNLKTKPISIILKLIIEIAIERLFFHNLHIHFFYLFI